MSQCIAGFILATLILFVLQIRRRTTHSLLRNRSLFTVSNANFEICTQDKVSISGTHLANGFSKCIIVCEGGGRTKDILGNILFCEWISDFYDVLTFDFRGHGKSGGVFSGTGETVEDLKAVIDYAYRLGYEKIGVMGRSLGGWTAILEAAKYRNVNSIVVGGAPAGKLYDVPLLATIYSKKLFRPIASILAWLMLGIRIVFVQKDHATPMSVISAVSPIPILFVYCENDQTIGMSQSDAEVLFNKADYPKQLVILPGKGHILESKYLVRYFDITKRWFEETL